ncbi:MAG: PDZ domain-containing protein [Ferruginibacter sp.]
MNKIIFSILTWLIAGFSYKAMAQEITIEDKDKTNRESQEIIIRKKGSKDVNLNIQINGDKITINGKPIVEFKDDEITINNRKVLVRDGNTFRLRDGNRELANMTWGNGANKPYLGVSTEKDDAGAKITDVVKGSPAEKAGLEKDDIITKLGDKKITGSQDLFDAVNAKKEKEEVKISYLRGKKEKSAKATLQLREGQSFSFTTPDGNYKSFSMPHMPPMPAMPDMHMEQFEKNLEGFYSPTFSRKQKLGLKIQDTDEGNGVKVLDVEDSSAAAKAGLKEGDLIVQIGENKISNTDEARTALEANSAKPSYPVKAKRNNIEMNFELKFPKKLKTASL